MKTRFSLKIFLSFLVITVISLVIISGYITKENPLTNLNSSNFNQLLQDKKTEIIYIGRPTCPQCKEFQPILEEQLKKEKLKIYYYNTDKARKQDEDFMYSILEKINVNAVPTLISIKDGKVDSEFIEYDNERALQQWLKENK